MEDVKNGSYDLDLVELVNERERHFLEQHLVRNWLHVVK